MILTRERKEHWTLLEKISFRFLFLYFTLYVFSIFTAPLWEPIVHWIGTSIFKIDYSFSSNGRGSGDTTYSYLLLFLFFCLAIIGSAIWSFMDQKRNSYNQLQYGFLVGLRCVIILFMVTYGIIKIFHLQMPELSNADLIKTLGEKSPMGLAWTFMGFSKTYSIFAGLSEVIAGVLLISRRTQTYGAMATIAVMVNVFMMNLCFDIPVKIFSFHLMLMGVLLLMVDFKRVFGVMIMNRNIGDYVIYPQLKKGDKNVLIICKWALLFLTVSFFVFTSYPRYKKLYLSPKTALFGVWKVTDFQKNGIKEVSYTGLKKSWKYIAIDRSAYASIKRMDDTQSYYKFDVDTLKNTIAFGDYSSKKQDTLTYQRIDSMLTISGVMNADSVFIELKQKPSDNFLLKSRGFHWINERPLNN